MSDKKRWWFVLNSDGLIYKLKEQHIDWESANNEAESTLDPIWLIDEYEAKNWAEFIMEELK